MDFGSLMMATTTLAGGAGLIVLSIQRFLKWRTQPIDEITVALVIGAVGFTLFIAGAYATWGFFS